MPAEIFVGHIGGDDFFLGLNASLHHQFGLAEIADSVRQHFETELMPFFTPDERAKKTYATVDRAGNPVELPLLSVSAAIIELTPGRKKIDADALSLLLAQTKKRAKLSASRIASATVES